MNTHVHGRPLLSVECGIATQDVGDKCCACGHEDYFLLKDQGQGTPEEPLICFMRKRSLTAQWLKAQAFHATYLDSHPDLALYKLRDLWKVTSSFCLFIFLPGNGVLVPVC